MQPQRPRRLDAVKVDDGAFLQHREIAGFGDLTDHAPQYRAALGCGAVTAQHIEGKARQAFTDDIGATPRLAGEKPRFLEQRQGPVQRWLGQLRCLHEFREGDGATRAHQDLEHAECLERGGGFARDFRGFDRQRQHAATHVAK